MVVDGVTRDFDRLVYEETGYYPVDLKAAFDLVANSKDWKAPVDAVVPVAMDGVVAAAVEFYTATKASFAVVKGGLRVSAAGYRAGPAGDH